MRFILLLSFLLTALVSPAATIRGRVTGGKAGEALPGAVVVVQGTSLSAPTDPDGRYELRNVPAGHYSVRVSYVGYREQTQSVTVAGDAAVTLDFALLAQTQDLGSVVVTGKLSKEEDAASRRTEHTADNVLNVIAARAIERSPDINVANVLTRVSGVAVQRPVGGSGGAYAVIRGLAPRYSNTLVNGVKVASPDAQARFLPLDIIPSDLVQRIEVHKALLPSMEGDAIGGTVNIVTKPAPDTTVFLATGSVGYNQLLLDRKYDWFNKADIQQKSPSERNQVVVNATPGDFSRNNLRVSPKQAPANSTFGLTYGRRFLNQQLGFIAAASWQDQYFGSNGSFAEVKPLLDETRASLVTVSAPRNTSSNQRNVGLVTHLDYIINAHNKIGWHNLLLLSDLAQARTSVDSSLVDQHTIAGTGTIHETLRTLTQQQFVNNTKLEGLHELRPNLLLDWAAVYTDGRERNPDIATLDTYYRLEVDGNDPAGKRIRRTQSFFGSATRVWQHNDNHDLSGLLNLTYQPTISGKSVELKAGGLYRHTNRNNRQDYYVLKSGQEASGIAQVYTNVDAVQWILYNPSGSSNRDPSNYDGTEDITDGYVQAKVGFGPLQVLGGVRTEYTNQRVSYLQAASILDTPIPDLQPYQDVLPSLHLRYALTANQNLRLSYFAGISRPSLAERSANTTIGPLTNLVGNPLLRHAQADNFDLRYELYQTDEGLFTAGVFYKRIIDPIEYAFVQVTGSQLVLQPRNFGTADNYGVEVVATKYLGNIGLSGNYTYVNSNISVLKTYSNTTTGSNVTSIIDRPLQGQARNVVNMSLLYRVRPARFYAQLSYQFTDHTLQVVNSSGPDYYLQPQSFLALSLEKGLSRRFVAFGKFNNLLNTSPTLKVGTSSLVVQRDEARADYLVGLRYVLR